MLLEHILKCLEIVTIFKMKPNFPNPNQLQHISNNPSNPAQPYMHVPQPQSPVLVPRVPVVPPYNAPHPILDEQLQPIVQHVSHTLRNQARMQDETNVGDHLPLEDLQLQASQAELAA